MMTCINVAEFVLISSLEKDHSMIEMRRLKNFVIFIQTILSFELKEYLLRNTLLPPNLFHYCLGAKYKCS